MILFGRARLARTLDAQLDAARQGLSGILVLKGPPGIGKTSLLAYAVERATGMRIAQVDGKEAEQDLGLAGLHRLLLPFLHDLDRLPAPQKEALSSAFGLVAGNRPDRLLVGLATLTLLANSAADRPLLCVCDDAQWLDEESLAVLAIVARRLQADGITLLFAIRDGDAGDRLLDDLPQAVLPELTRSDSHALLARTLSAQIEQGVAERIVTEAAGNPLAIRELAGDLESPAGADPVPLSERLPLGRQLQARYLRQSRALPGPTRTLLLVIAADPTGDRALVWRAAARLDSTGGATDLADLAAPATAAGLLVLQPAPAFRHPLIRSAVYDGSAPADRRRAHAALAAATDTRTDADRRAWHLAAACEGRDETTAAELERAATRARARGGHSAACAFLTRAADLTPLAVPRAARLLAACEAALAAGRPDRAQSLLQHAVSDAGTTHLARRLRLQGAIHIQNGRETQAATDLLAAARAYSPGDRRAARDTLLEAFQAVLGASWLGGDVTAPTVARAALDLPTAPGPPDPADLLLTAHATQVLQGPEAAAPLLRAAVHALAEPGTGPSDVGLLLLGLIAAHELWDGEAFRALAARTVESSRDLGALDLLRVSLHAVASADTWFGRFAEAESNFAAFRELVGAIDGSGRLAEGSDVILLAWRGIAEATRAAMTAMDVERSGQASGGVRLQTTRTALAVLENGSSHYAHALAVARLGYAEDPVYFGNPALVEMVEAGTRSGDHEAARAALLRLTPRASAAGTPWALGLLARSQALLADGDEADALYRQALGHLRATDIRTELARTHLLYGEWLRRRRHRGEAREQLRTAFQLFGQMGAHAFAERARHELRAIGDKTARRTPAGVGGLTPREGHIAGLAAQGATNQDIATQLFISASTVEYHLRKVFQKLAITSRRQLPRVLEQPATPS
ncbi:AAA family ATPase [Kitasatospora purpeofusca]|uniref:AAA family ATPase n=1 Tax=Kitasatospora purpeofusca TaxID=67352 RepID=UPI002A59EC06|nr:AAA family ATPase [Kitasatospora purpeofusca]MDY0815070.1 LuxR C-terminal-related transcriptional regulator [Kitasatospora purpeofusca]